jgi:prolyl oligopeptidase
MTALRSFSRPAAAAALLASLSLPVAGAFAQSASPASAPAAMAAAPSAAASSAEDPYLWLEKVDSPDALAWVRAQNEKTLSVLEKDPRFATFHSEALAIAQAKDRIPNPSQLDGRVFNFWQDSDHVRGIWRTVTPRDYDKGGDLPWETVLDLDKIAAAEHANWVWEGANCEKRREQRCLLALSDGGEDAVTLREFDVRRAAFVTKGGFGLPKGKQRAAWQDENTLLVSREWNPGELTASGYPYIVKMLRRGQPLSAAKEIFRGQPTDGGYGVEPQALVDAAGHRALLINRPLSTFESEQYIVTPAGVKRLALPAKEQVLELSDGQLLVHVMEPWKSGGVDVPAGALVALDLKKATAHPGALEPVIVYAPKPHESFEGAAATKSGLVVSTLDNVRGRIWVYARNEDNSWTPKPVGLPDNATLGIVDADPHSDNAYVSAAGFLVPSSLWRVAGDTGDTLRVHSLPAKFDASGEEVEQLEATSTDGTKIPYFIVHPKKMALDGSHPAILYAYGGFDIAITPSYAAVMGKLWLEHGGVYVVANIRGGGEFGPAWHEAGLKTKRQIIYDDFASVAKDLVARQITSQRRLGIMGGSNGGLLMGVEMTEHPELWNAVDIQVPLLDMMRYEQIAAGTSWVGEYGSVSVPAEREFLEKISPYRNLRRDAKYPRALIWTTTKDDRVGPQHARKFAARLEEYGIPYYYYEVIEGGHGSGANLKERAHTNAIEYTYFARQLMDE